MIPSNDHHQNETIEKARASLRKHQSTIILSPTGSGKTQMAASMIGNCHNKGHNVIFMCHRKELVFQTGVTFEKHQIPHTFIAAGKHYNPRMRVVIASVGTLVNRLDKIKPPKLLVIDECHHTNSASFAKCFNWAKKHGAKIIGLTASPYRLSGEGLGEYFEDMVEGPNPKWLMSNINPRTGLTYLSKFRAFAPSAPDLSKIHMQGGDFKNDELEAIMSGKAILSGCVGHWKKYAYGKRTIGFAVSINHSKLLVKEFNEAGIPAVHVDGNTPEEERKLAFINFAEGHIPILWNVGIASEGLDLSAIAGKDVPIEAVIQARPTQSLSMHVQQMGRALRPKEEPAIIIDLAGNVLRHGLPDSEFEWSLEPRQKKKKSDQDKVEKMRQCPSCYSAHDPWLKECPDCGHVYETAGRQMEEVEGDLKEVVRPQSPPPQVAAPKINIKNIDQLSLQFEELLKVAKESGKEPWEAQRWAAARFTSNIAKSRAMRRK